MDLKNCIFEELLKAAQPKRGSICDTITYWFW